MTQTELTNMVLEYLIAKTLEGNVSIYIEECASAFPSVSLSAFQRALFLLDSTGDITIFSENGNPVFVTVRAHIMANYM